MKTKKKPSGVVDNMRIDANHMLRVAVHGAMLFHCKYCSADLPDTGAIEPHMWIFHPVEWRRDKDRAYRTKIFREQRLTGQGTPVAPRFLQTNKTQAQKRITTDNTVILDDEPSTPISTTSSKKAKTGGDSQGG